MLAIGIAFAAFGVLQSAFAFTMLSAAFTVAIVYIVIGLLIEHSIPGRR